MNKEICCIAEQCSKPKSGVHELALLQLRPYIEGFLDATWISSELKKYEAWAAKNSDPFLQRSLLHSPPGFNMLAASIWAARDWEKIYKDQPSFSVPAGAKRLVNIACSLSVLELYAGQLLDQKARECLRKRLQHAEHVWGAIHELHTFTCFVRQGATVQPHFLKKASPQEIILQWQSVEIPVQCKSIKPGSGRLISQEVFTRLACYIARDAGAKKKRLLVRIGSTGNIRDEDVEFLRRAISDNFGAGMRSALVTNNRRTFMVHLQPLSGQFTVKKIRDYLSSFNFHVGMIIGEPALDGTAYDVVAVVGIDADLKEKPWNTLLSSIQKGADQLKGGPPGIIAINYADPVSDFESLRQDDRPLKVVLGKLLTPRPHVGAVMLTSEPDLQLPMKGAIGKPRIYHRLPWPFPKDFLSERILPK